MLQFFWNRSASVWTAALYLLLGLLLLLFPAESGTLLVWVLCAITAVYGLGHLWRYLQKRRYGLPCGSEVFLTLFPLAFSAFALLRPQAVLSFLPLVLGALLALDGVGKLPPVVSALHRRSEDALPLVLSALLPLVLGIILLWDPYRAARTAIALFGAGLVAGGAGDLAAALLARPRS